MHSCFFLHFVKYYSKPPSPDIKAKETQFQLNINLVISSKNGFFFGHFRNDPKNSSLFTQTGHLSFMRRELCVGVLFLFLSKFVKLILPQLSFS